MVTVLKYIFLTDLLLELLVNYKPSSHIILHSIKFGFKRAEHRLFVVVGVIANYGTSCEQSRKRSIFLQLITLADL